MRCAAARRLHAHLGRRGIFLLMLGVGKICWGVGFIAEPLASTRGLDLLTNAAPMACWAWVWILPGTIMVGCAFLRIGRDRFGFTVALVPPGVWAVAYAVGAANGEYDRGWFIAVWYGVAHIGVILWAATVPEHSVPHRPRP